MNVVAAPAAVRHQLAAEPERNKLKLTAESYIIEISHCYVL